MTPSTSWIGLGVAGNFAGHLEQAGESRDFAGLKRQEGLPKGMFPFRVDLAGHRLEIDPVSDAYLQLPPEGDVQMEPETCLLLDLSRLEDGSFCLRPSGFAAFDDTSVRREGAKKISEKKHWGPCSKGLASEWIPLSDLGPNSIIHNWRIASFVLRDGTWHAYGEDAPLAGYSLFGQPLLDWMETTLATQRDEGPLEDLAALWEAAGQPATAVVTIGATRYTPWGETHFLQAGDETAVLLYDPSRHISGTLDGILASTTPLPGTSLLRRRVVASA